MLFAIGTRVRFRYTGESGVITAKLDDTTLLVRLNSDPSMEIPTYEEDLIRDTGAEPVSAGAKFILPKKEKEKTPEAPPRREVKGPKSGGKASGIQIAFEPMPGKDGGVSRYKIWLINDTAHEFLTEFDLLVDDRNQISSDDKLSASTALEMGDLLSDQLNDAPEIDLSVRRITTAGPDEALSKTLKIKPKQFFNSVHMAPLLQVLTHLYPVFSSFETRPEVSTPGDDLLDYTRQQVKKKPAAIDANAVPYRAFDVEEFASFIPEIDLHIERLINGHARLDKSEILRIQMNHFHRFLERAIRLGVPRVFVIHGMGEGKLRDAIAAALRGRPDIAKFKNEFHAKYGYGATEVVFK